TGSTRARKPFPVTSARQTLLSPGSGITCGYLGPHNGVLVTGLNMQVSRSFFIKAEAASPHRHRWFSPLQVHGNRALPGLALEGLNVYRLHALGALLRFEFNLLV